MTVDGLIKHLDKFLAKAKDADHKKELLAKKMYDIPKIANVIALGAAFIVQSTNTVEDVMDAAKRHFEVTGDYPVIVTNSKS